MFQVRNKGPGLWGGREEPRSLKAFVQSLKHQGVFVDSTVSDWRAIALGQARLICSKQGGCNIRSFLRTSMLDQSSVLLEAIGYSISLSTLCASIRKINVQINWRKGWQVVLRHSQRKARRTYAKLVRAEGQAGILWANAHRKSFSRSHMNTEGQALLN